MGLKRIDKSRLGSFLSDLMKERDVIAPVRRGDVVRFRPIESADEAVFDEWNTRVPLKEVFFPQTECLYTYGSDPGRIDIKPPPPPRERVVVGVRPCDARSIAILDHVFASGDRQDNYYVDKRNRTTLVGMACLHPLDTCFCGAVGGSPFGEEGLDALLIDTGASYVAGALTEKGEKLLGGWEDATAEDESAVAQAREAAEKAVEGRAVPDGVKAVLDECFEDPVWERIHERCLGCGTCSYLCPTCHCFDMTDEPTAAGGRRMRVWDTCMFPLFTRHASGANPRPSGKERMRQRVMHKFRYFLDNYDVTACVGCGRCVIHCPVNLDIREVLQQIEKLRK